MHQCSLRSYDRATSVSLLMLFTTMLCLVGCSSPLDGLLTSRPTPTPLPAPTATPLPPYELLDMEVVDGTTLRGYVLGPILETLADGVQCNFYIFLGNSSLNEVQSDAYQIFKAIWTGTRYHIPSDWKVHLIFDIGATSQDTGTPIAVANLTYTTAQGFPWAQLSPAQAWQRYDGTLYDPNGIA